MQPFTFTFSLVGALLTGIAPGQASAQAPAQEAGAPDSQPRADPHVYRFAPPEPVLADGQPIDVGKDVGHAVPSLHDLDGDGRLDLLVGTFKGKLHSFRNLGTNAAPRYGASVLLQSGGEPIEIDNW